MPGTKTQSRSASGTRGQRSGSGSRRPNGPGTTTSSHVATSCQSSSGVEPCLIISGRATRLPCAQASSMSGWISGSEGSGAKSATQRLLRKAGRFAAVWQMTSEASAWSAGGIARRRARISRRMFSLAARTFLSSLMAKIQVSLSIPCSKMHERLHRGEPGAS